MALRAGLAAIAAGIAVAACAAAPAPIAPRDPEAPRAPATAAPPAPPACVAPEVDRELACPAGGPAPIPAVPPFTWPVPGALFHVDAPWERPIDPRALAAAVGRDARDRGDDPAAMARLDAADRAFEAASAPRAQYDPAERRAAAWTAAATAFAQARAAIGPAHRLAAWAAHRHARALWSSGRADAALRELTELLRALRDRPPPRGAGELAAVARADLPALVADAVIVPEAVAPMVRGLVDDDAPAAAMVQSIADAYVAAGKHDGARTIGRAGPAAPTPAAACELEARALGREIVARHASIDRLADAAIAQIARHEAVARGDATAAEKERCRAATLAPVIEIATAWHVDALGSRGVRGTGDRKEIRGAAALYDRVMEAFTPEELAATPRPGVPEAMAPSAVRIALARATIARFVHEWDRCAAESERAVGLAQDVGARAAATTIAVECLDRDLEATLHGEPSPGSPAVVEATPRIERLVAHAGRLLCATTTSPADPAATARRRAVELARGARLAQLGAWERAAAALRALAFERGDADAREAAEIWVRAMARLAPGRAACADELAAARPRLARLHCPEGSPCDAILPPPTTPPSPAPPRDLDPRAPTIRFDAVSVTGTTPPEIVAWTIGLYRGAMRACYEAALRRDPFLGAADGPATITLRVDRDGGVSEVRAVHHDAEHTPFASCLGRVAARMSFIQPEGGRIGVRVLVWPSLEAGIRIDAPTTWVAEERKRGR